MKKFSLQFKIFALTWFLISIPLLLANYIFFAHRSLFETEKIYTGMSSYISSVNYLNNQSGMIDENSDSEEDNDNEDEDEDEEKSVKKADSPQKDIEDEAEEDNEDEEEDEDNEDESENKKSNVTSKTNEDEDFGIDNKSSTDKVDDKTKTSTETDSSSQKEEIESESESESESDSEQVQEQPNNTNNQKSKEQALLENELNLKSKKAEVLNDFLQNYDEQIRGHEKSLNSLKHWEFIFLFGSFIYFILSGFIIWTFLASSASPFKNISEHLKNIQNEKEEVPNDIIECAIKFDHFLTTAKTLLQESYSITLEINRKLEPLTVMSVFSDDNVKQFFTDVQEISRSSNYIANTLDSTTAHIQEVSASAQTIADRSHEAATDSAETAAIAGEGKNAVSETIDTMESIKDEVLGLEDVIENLNSASKQIGEIVNTITGIAYQTNLLALNAAIEAARAGEHGQGFTVVANEVKKLAEESGEAAEDISKKIKEMLKKTGIAVETINRGATKVIEGVNIANIAGNNLDKIVASVSNVNKMIQDISNASTEQSENIDSLRGSIESITGATKITSEGTKRVATAVTEQLSHIKEYISVTKELLTLVQMMGDMLDKFNLN